MSGKTLEVGLSARPRILLADCDGAMVEAIEAALGRDAAVYEKVYDGRAALDRAERFQPDLIILEANLPKMSGFMMLQKIRKVANQKPFVIMIAEGCGNRHQLYATQQLGAEAFFHKPVRMRKLIERVEQILGVKLMESYA